MHPAPGAVGRPSFASLVSSVDLMTAKYIPCSRVQKGRQEIIEDLEDMVNVCGAAFYAQSRTKGCRRRYLPHTLAMEPSKREKMRRPVSFSIEVYPIIYFYWKHVLTFIFKTAFPNPNFHTCLLKVRYFSLSSHL